MSNFETAIFNTMQIISRLTTHEESTLLLSYCAKTEARLNPSSNINKNYN